MKVFSLKMWRRAMSLVVFLFGVTVLLLLYLVWTLVPPGTDPRTAGQALARDPRAGLIAEVLGGLFLTGLALVGSRIAYFVYARVSGQKRPMAEHKHSAPRFSRCPICTASVPFGFLGRDFRGHLRSEHRGYWGWRRKWNITMTLTMLTWLVLFFPLLASGIIPGIRTGATAATFYGIGAFFLVEIAVIGLGAWFSRSGTRRFRQEWLEQHSLNARIYGNLKGIKARLKFHIGRTFIFKDPLLPLELLQPATLLLVPVILLLGQFTLRKVKLDKFEEGRLWLYDAFDTLVSFEVQSPAPSRPDLEKITFALKRGSMDIVTENSSELQAIRSVLSAGTI